MTMGFGARLRRLDIFKKVPRNLSQPTNVGGFLSLLLVFVASALLYIEIEMFNNPTYVAKIFPDRELTREQLIINLDISIPHFPCQILSLDLTDVMISHSANIGSVDKWRLDSDGNQIDSRPFELLHESNPLRQHEIVKEAFLQQRGCRVEGSFTVKEVPGNFHISMHSYFGHYQQILQSQQVGQLNMSHTIHKLYFGKEHHLAKLKKLHPEANVHPLQSTTITHLQPSNSQYHLDIVPTWYHEGTFNNYYTYQYTTVHSSTSRPGDLPILNFNYHIGGLSVAIFPAQSSLFAFIAQLCSIIGGLYAIINALHNSCVNWFPSQYQLLE